MDNKILDKYLFWGVDKFREELRKAQAALESANNGMISHREQEDRTKRQEEAAVKYSEIMQVLRYLSGERDTLPGRTTSRHHWAKKMIE
jgi:hypothetical protein